MSMVDELPGQGDTLYDELFNDLMEENGNPVFSKVEKKAERKAPKR